MTSLTSSSTSKLASQQFFPNVLLSETLQFLGEEKKYLRRVSKTINKIVEEFRKSIIFNDHRYLDRAGKNVDNGYIELSKRSPGLEKIALANLPYFSYQLLEFFNVYNKQIRSLDFFCDLVDPVPPHLASHHLTTLSIRVHNYYFHNRGLILRTFAELAPNLTAITYRECYGGLHRGKIKTEKYGLDKLKKLNFLNLHIAFSDTQIFEELGACLALKTLKIFREDHRIDLGDRIHEEYVLFNGYLVDVQYHVSVYDQGYFLMLLTEKSSLEELKIEGFFPQISLKEGLMMQVMNRLKGLHTLEFLTLAGVTDDLLEEFAAFCPLRSLALNFSLITNTGFNRFVQRALQLKRLCAEHLCKVEEIKPLVDHCRLLRVFEGNNHPYIASLNDLTNFSRLKSLEKLSVRLKDSYQKNGNSILLVNKIRQMNKTCKNLIMPLRLYIDFPYRSLSNMRIDQTPPAVDWNSWYIDISREKKNDD